MKSAFKAGFIAAVVGTTSMIGLSWIGYLAMGLGFEESPLGPPIWTMVTTLLGVFWGTIFGIVYSKVYDIIPGKAVRKGFYFGMIVLLLTSVNINSYYILALANPWGIAGIIGGLYYYIVYGPVLGYLYKKE